MISNKDENIAVGHRSDEGWLEGVDSELPVEFTESCRSGKLPPGLTKRKVMLTVRAWPNGNDLKIKAKLTDTLGQVFSEAAGALREPLLPPTPDTPFDVLRARLQRGGWSKPVMNLEEPLWVALGRGFTRHFAIEYKLIVKINSRWGIAPAENATPRQLLAAFDMDASEFTLYPVDGNVEFPVDVPLSIKRGDRFEAQKDGKYGSGGSASAIGGRGSQTITDDVQAAKETGLSARLLEVGEQKYVEVQHVDIPSPPWGAKRVTILIAIPHTYPSGGLDAFYLQLPLTHTGGDIPYKQNVAQINGSSWALISWHYHESRPWNPLQDNLSTHIQHCRGFFLTRGVKG